MREWMATTFVAVAPRGPTFGTFAFLGSLSGWEWGWEEKEEEREEEVSWLSPAFGGLLRDPIGSTPYWEIDRAVMRLLLL